MGITILILVIVLLKKGVHGILEFIKQTGDVVCAFFGWMNTMIVGLTGNGFFTVLFGSAFVFVIFGFIMDFFDFPRGKIGSIFNKILFWLIGFPVSFILNYLSWLVFK